LLAIQALTEEANGVTNSHSTRVDCRAIPHLLSPVFDEIAQAEFGYTDHIGLETMSKNYVEKACPGCASGRNRCLMTCNGQDLQRVSSPNQIGSRYFLPAARCCDFLCTAYQIAVSDCQYSNLIFDAKSSF
jgi:hypothetical protein